MNFNKGFLRALKRAIEDFDVDTCISIYKHLNWEVWVNPETSSKTSSGAFSIPDEEIIYNVLYDLALAAYKCCENGELEGHAETMGLKVSVYHVAKDHDDYLPEHQGYIVDIFMIAVQSSSLC